MSKKAMWGADIERMLQNSSDVRRSEFTGLFDAVDPHAVRWVVRISAAMLGTKIFSKWHYTKDANLTLCGRRIPSMTKYATMPEFDNCEDDLEVVECCYCRKKLGI